MFDVKVQQKIEREREREREATKESIEYIQHNSKHMALPTLVMHFPIQFKEASCCTRILFTCTHYLHHGEIHIEIQHNNTKDSIKRQMR